MQPNSPPAGPSAARRIKVMVVDDSVIIRTVITRLLKQNPDMEVVASAVDGKNAVETVRQASPDIILLDIEMPVMDGITAIPLLLKEKPGVKIVMCSTLSARGAEISIRALALGAAECLLKPAPDAVGAADEFQKNLVNLIRGLGSASIRPDFGVPGTQAAKKPISLHPGKHVLPPRIIAIGSSTGGPQALISVLKGMEKFPVPIVITQHMPKNFTAYLAQNIERSCKIPCFEGADGMVIKNGCAYVAPGGYHMTLNKEGADVVIRINEEPPENFCRPSVNPMVRSLLSIYGNRVLIAILTGMGGDGKQACEDAVKLGAQVIAQDEATSAVWGMPAAVANAGLCTAVLPLDEINPWMHKAVKL